MTSESFVDTFGTSIVVRLQDGHEHVQLLMNYRDGSEPTSYGFTIDDFKMLAKVIRVLEESLP